MAKRQSETINTKHCPYCGEVIAGTAILCRFCRSDLTAANHSGLVTDHDTMIRHALAGRYELEAEIGRGAMATVYKGIQKNLNREVAVKVIMPALVHDREFVDRFHFEARIAASLNHPNIVRIYDEGEINGVHFIAMEYLEGSDLLDVIQRKGRLDVLETLNYAYQTSLALEYIHQRKLLHRDVKSSNIFITQDQRAILTDFGIARANNGQKLTRRGEVLGTPAYMSPEQAKGEALDERSDLYSLGIIIYECLTGAPPFKGQTPLLTLNEVINNLPAPIVQLRPDIPAGVNKVVMNLLAKSPTGRTFDEVSLSRTLHGLMYSRPEAKLAPPPEKQAVQDAGSATRKEVARQKVIPTPGTGRQKPAATSSAARRYNLKILAILSLSALLLILLVIGGVFLFAPDSVPGNPEPVDRNNPGSARVPQNTPVRVPPAAVPSSPANPAGTTHDTVPPTYPGGSQAIQRFVADNTDIPSEMLTGPGQMTISFVISQDGSVSSCRVVNGYNFEVDPLVLKTLGDLPGHFSPGTIDKVPQRMNYIVLIKLPLK